ncbi:950_t:CDS:2 [Entrophospora sp. SA101]|nr:950_t:CDS:2 [Entrophospora sp. SA101]
MGYWNKEQYAAWSPSSVPKLFPPNRSHGPDLQKIVYHLYCLKMKLKSKEDLKKISTETRKYLNLMFRSVCSCQDFKDLQNPLIRDSLDIALSDILDNIIPSIELGNPPPFIPFRETSYTMLNDFRNIEMICDDLMTDLEEYAEIDEEFSVVRQRPPFKAIFNKFTKRTNSPLANILLKYTALNFLLWEADHSDIGFFPSGINGQGNYQPILRDHLNFDLDISLTRLAGTEYSEVSRTIDSRITILYV